MNKHDNKHTSFFLEINKYVMYILLGSRYNLDCVNNPIQIFTVTIFSPALKSTEVTDFPS
jgi:hypothetical protein